MTKKQNKKKILGLGFFAYYSFVSNFVGSHFLTFIHYKWKDSQCQYRSAKLRISWLSFSQRFGSVLKSQFITFLFAFCYSQRISDVSHRLVSSIFVFFVRFRQLSFLTFSLTVCSDFHFFGEFSHSSSFWRLDPDRSFCFFFSFFD